MKKKIMNTTSNKASSENPGAKMSLGSDALFIALAGIYIISRPLLVSSTIIDIAVGVSLLLIALKQYIIARRSKQ
ncbi:MAG: hypothetical protein GX348_06225 [Veillonellaceae bacterium]|jgi:hypothetical protein|nr:hypothetical protein [Veillonellaceae bacterium]